MIGETVEMNLGAQSDLGAAEMEVQEEMEMRDAEEVKETKAWEDREVGTSEEPEQEPGENWEDAEPTEESGENWEDAEPTEESGENWEDAEPTEESGEGWEDAEPTEEPGENWEDTESTAEEAEDALQGLEEQAGSDQESRSQKAQEQARDSEEGEEAVSSPDSLAFIESLLDERIVRAIREMGFVKLSPIQEMAIPYLLDGDDIIGQAQTGTGKTAAFGIPALQKIDPDLKKLQTVILCPTRELAMQAAEELRKIAKYMH